MLIQYNLWRYYNPGQNSLAKRILFTYFSKYCSMPTLNKILRTLVPPPTSMLLFSMKSLPRNMFICANNLDIRERGAIWRFCHIFCPGLCSWVSMFIKQVVLPLFSRNFSKIINYMQTCPINWKVWLFNLVTIPKYWGGGVAPTSAVATPPVTGNVNLALMSLIYFLGCFNFKTMQEASCN